MQPGLVPMALMFGSVLHLLTFDLTLMGCAETGDSGNQKFKHVQFHIDACTHHCIRMPYVTTNAHTHLQNNNLPSNLPYPRTWIPTDIFTGGI
jgi:hypothetical protein